MTVASPRALRMMWMLCPVLLFAVNFACLAIGWRSGTYQDCAEVVANNGMLVTVLLGACAAAALSLILTVFWCIRGREGGEGWPWIIAAGLVVVVVALLNMNYSLGSALVYSGLSPSRCG